MHIHTLMHARPGAHYTNTCTREHIPCNGLICLHGRHSGLKQLPLHVKICVRKQCKLLFCHITFLSNSPVSNSKSAYERKEAEKRHKPVLTSEPKYTRAPGNRSACRQTDRQTDRQGGNRSHIKTFGPQSQFLRKHGQIKTNLPLFYTQNRALPPHPSLSQVHFGR